MFQPDHRLLLTEALRPPSGYAFDRAVATTFTLDLTAALVAPISLGAQRWGDRTDPITLMESVRAVADRVDLFCQSGMVTVPSTATDLIAFLEPMVHEVQTRRSNDLFHPKIWLIRFTRPDAPAQMRLMCSSRNITNDRSWDLLVTLDGEVTDEVDAWNQPIADLVRGLPALAVRGVTPERSAAIQSLADDAMRCEWELPPDVEALYFHTLGLGAEPPDFSGNSHFVISAFANDAGLQRITEGGRSLTLISRADELARLAPETIRGATLFTLDPGVGLDDDTEHLDTNLTGLHAKAVIVDHHRAFIGSMNATGQAQNGNVEFLVELHTKQRQLSATKLLDPDDPSGLFNILQEYEPRDDDPPEPDDWSLERDLRAAASADFVTTITADADAFALTVAAHDLPSFENTTTTIAPHARRGDARSMGNQAAVRFEGIALADISPFLVLRIERGGQEQSTIVRSRLIGDPDGRLDAVIARQVDTPEKLLRFIMLVLQLAADGSSDIDLTATGDGSDAWWSGGGLADGVMESIAIALADHPAALDDIDRLIERLGSTPDGAKALPNGLTELWDQVRIARRRLKR